ncbi:50S ribosomal protein L6 [Candidatus Gottesmanbacteria bacterium]|nr:50S ribosomal protein L6 [Candidatus Gottesmanbacteria bacterium]
MSRIGMKPIQRDSTVTFSIEGRDVLISGPKGKVVLRQPQDILLKVNDKDVFVEMKSSKGEKSTYGLFRSILANAITGVTTPWTKSLELVGVGYRAQTSGQELILHLGFSHPVKIQAPEGISFGVSENIITVSGVDKYLVGEVAATIHRIKKPEPYKGKGIRYKGEYIRKKLGKAAKAVGATGAK